MILRDTSSKTHLCRDCVTCIDFGLPSDGFFGVDCVSVGVTSRPAWGDGAMFATWYAVLA